MNPGRMDRQLTLQRFTTTQNAIGEAVKTWTTYADRVPTSIKPERASERVNGDKLEAENKTTFIIRWMSGVNAADRLQYEGVIYDIKNVREVNRRAYLELDATRQV
jgi:SPP1 family predicted phage head-tail adaptor